ncbi:MAG TPA: hypothetical protein VHE55_16785 [Fimbriimonadaceae bacterium]|nr:hypothetical protein [Fimbriimonadaceae bacterium]
MKLSGWTIIVACVCLGLSAFFFAYFQVYSPYEQAAQYFRDYHTDLNAAADKMPLAVKRVKKAMEMVNADAQQWNQYVATKTPSDSLFSGGVNINENPYQLVVDSPKFRNSAQRAFNAQLHVGDVKVVSAPEIPQPTDSEKDILASYYNFPAISFPVVIWELGAVTVTGRYDQIMKNVRSWSNMDHYLAVVDGLRLDGTSPNLTATYNVTIVGFIRASRGVFPAPQVAIGSTSSSGGGGFTPTSSGGSNGGAGQATMKPAGGG